MARQFNTGEYLSFSDSSVLDAHASTNTWATWIYIDSFNGAGDAYISEIFTDFDGADFTFLFRLGGGGFLATQKRIGLGTSGGDRWSLTDLTTGVWTHIGCVSDGSDTHFYLNGTLDYSFGAASSFTNQSNSWVIGKLPGLDRAVHGRLADIAYWSGAALTVGEFNALYKGFPPSMIRPQSLAFYSPIDGRVSPEQELRHGISLTVNGTLAFADPPALIRRRGRPTIFVPSVAVTKVGRIVGRIPVGTGITGRGIVG